MNESILKQELFEIKSNHLTIMNNKTYDDYALQMLNQIGTTDSELRDDLIYEIFAQWIIEQNCFSKEQLNSYLKICMDNNHLMYYIGEEQTDTVYTRTFSALIIALIIYKHNQENFLSNETIIKAKDIMIDYMSMEKDLRGYVDKKGWAHSVAHGSDVIDELAKCSIIDKEALLKFLDVFYFKICQGKYVFIDGEPGRICIAITSILDRNLILENEVILWLEKFLNEIVKDGKIESFHKKINIKNFLMSLYFSLKTDSKNLKIISKAESILAVL